MLAELQDKYNMKLDAIEGVNVAGMKTIDTQVEELKATEASGSQEKNALNSQVDQLKKDAVAARNDAQKSINSLNNEIKAMAQEIQQERKLRDEAL